MPESKNLTINISTQTILKILLVVVLVGFVSLIKDVLFLLFVALVLAAAIDPSISLLQRRGVPRGFGIAILYIGILGLVSLVVILFVPVVARQLEQLSHSLPVL